MIRVRACIVVPAALLLAPLSAHAQQLDEQLWLQANGTKALDGDTRLTIEGIARFGDAADGLSHTEFGGQLSHKLRSSVEIAVGYRHVQDYDHGRRVPNEERLRQMITFPLGGGLSTRSRLEERFSSAEGDIAVRLRQQLRYSAPLNRHGLTFYLTHESFLNLNATDWGVSSGYDRMRHTLGVSIPLGKGLRADTGYLNEYRFGRSGGRDQLTHAATLTLNLDL
jgi:hypothetical protein